METNYQLLITVAVLSILQGHWALPTPQAQVAGPDPASTVLFLDDVGGLVTGIINTGLRSLSVLIADGSVATRKLAADVGVASVPSLLQVSKSFDRVRNSGQALVNNGRRRLPATSQQVSDLSTRIATDVRPAVQDFNRVIDQQNGLFPRRRPAGGAPRQGIIGSGLILNMLGLGPKRTVDPSAPVANLEPSFDDIPETIDWDA